VDHLSSSLSGTEAGRSGLGLLECVPLPLCAIDPTGNVVGVNATLLDWLQWTAGALIGRPLAQLGLDAQAQSLLDQSARATLSNPAEHAPVLVWCQTGAGTPVLAELRLSAPGDPAFPPGWKLAAWVDVTAHHQERQALAQTMGALHEAHTLSQELALVADRSPNVVMICDGLQRIRWVNTSFTRLTGYTLAEARGRKPTELLADPHASNDLWGMLEARLRRGQAIERAHLSRRAKDGRVYMVEATLLPILDDEGLISRHIIIEQDISERLRAEAEREALMRAEASHTAKTEFLSRMSHNMRTPLNAVMGFAHLLKSADNPPLHPQHRERVEVIHQAGQQLLGLVDQALQLARLEHALEAYESMRVPVAPLLQECVDMLRSRASRKDHAIDVRVIGPGLAVRADPQRAREIVLNLLSNAIKYSPTGRPIFIEALRDDEHHQALISVHDLGVGIAEADLPLLFQPFTRLDRTQDMASGHGMGLAISRRLATLMQGSLTVQSQPGVGSTFTLSLPLDSSDDEALPSTPAESDDEQMPALPALRLLCVEDHAMNRMLIEAVFSAYPQVQVVMAASLTEGLDAVRTTDPDVVLLDINLPDGNGLNLCRTVRDHPDWPQPLVIALSADALPEHIDAAMACGVDHYLVKPLQIRRLLDILAQYPSTTPPQAP